MHTDFEENVKTEPKEGSPSDTVENRIEKTENGGAASVIPENCCEDKNVADAAASEISDNGCDEKNKADTAVSEVSENSCKNTSGADTAVSEGPDKDQAVPASEEKKYPWTARRVVALVGIILLLALYGSTLVFALMKSPNAKGLLMASIFCTIVVPVLLHTMTVIARNIRSNHPKDQDDKRQ